MDGRRRQAVSGDNMHGEKYMGIDRSTFLVGPDGRIVKAWRRVSVNGHIEEVLETARQVAR
jgi:peroxiredoxin Q/BCP